MPSLLPSEGLLPDLFIGIKSDEGMNLRSQFALVFDLANAREDSINRRWISISNSIGGKLTNSLLVSDLQRVGGMDTVLRCFETEISTYVGPRDPNEGVTEFHYQALLSEMWIGSNYEIFRLLKQRKLLPISSDFLGIFRDLEILRMPIEKYEIAKDKKLTQPLEMSRIPLIGKGDEYIYDSKDPKRAHIMPKALSVRGSCMWHAIDLETASERWIERLDLSQRMLAFWEHVGSEA